MLCREDFLMHAHHQNLFIVRTIKMPILPRDGRCGTARRGSRGQLRGGGLFEAGNVARLRIYPGHYMLDQAVFTGGVHGLDDEEDCHWF